MNEAEATESPESEETRELNDDDRRFVSGTASGEPSLSSFPMIDR